MGAIFGKRSNHNSPSTKLKESKITENDRVVLKLKQQRDKIKQYQKRINIQLEKEKDVVRKLIQDNKKERALLLLKKKRFMETQLEKSDNHLIKIEEMVQTIEYQEMQIDIVERLKAGNEALKRLNDALDIDKIEDILSESKEGAEKQKEISRLFSGQAGDEIINDDELIEELNEMMINDKGEQLSNTIDTDNLPTVDNLEPVKVSDISDEEDEKQQQKIEKQKEKQAKKMLEAS